MGLRWRRGTHEDLGAAEPYGPQDVRVQRPVLVPMQYLAPEAVAHVGDAVFGERSICRCPRGRAARTPSRFLPVPPGAPRRPGSPPASRWPAGWLRTVPALAALVPPPSENGRRSSITAATVVRGSRCVIGRFYRQPFACLQVPRRPRSGRRASSTIAIRRAAGHRAASGPTRHGPGAGSAVPDRRRHAPHLAVAALADANLEPGRGNALAKPNRRVAGPERGSRDAFHPGGQGGAVLQHHTLGAALQARRRSGSPSTCTQYVFHVLWRGSVRRCCSRPSSVSNSRPSLSRSRRPAGIDARQRDAVGQGRRALRHR